MNRNYFETNAEPNQWYPFQAWLISVVCGGPLIIYVRQIIMHSAYGPAYGMDFEYLPALMLFGLLFSLPAFTVFYLLFRLMSFRGIRPVVVKTTLLIITGLGIYITFSILFGSGEYNDIVGFYSIGVAPPVLFFRIYRKNPNKISLKTDKAE
jgi:hypothetical protein